MNPQQNSPQPETDVPTFPSWPLESFLENFFDVNGLAHDFNLGLLQTIGGGVVDTQFPTLANVNHVATGNWFDSRYVSRQRGSRWPRVGRVNNRHCGVRSSVIDRKAALGYIRAGAGSDKKLAVAPQRDSVVNAIRDADAARRDGTIGRVGRVHESQVAGV